MKGVDVESNFVPLVGDYVSLNGCVGVPFYIQARTLKVVNRTYNGEHGTELTIPLGISRYPNNTLFGIFGWISILIWIFLFYLIEDS